VISQYNYIAKHRNCVISDICTMFYIKLFGDVLRRSMWISRLFF